MSNNVSQEIKAYIDKRTNINKTILNYLNDENLENDFSIQKYFDNLKTQESGIELKIILDFMAQIIDNHHQNQGIFYKIVEIIMYFKEDIKQYFSNLEIFNIFSKNKKILYFLFEKNMIIPDDSIIDILSKPSNNIYLMPVIEMYYTDQPFLDDDQEKKEKRKSGENDSTIAKLIREDSVEEFIAYITKQNYKPNCKISKSHFETNPLLNSKEPTLIEYAAFFGSIQIFRYLAMNDADLTPSIWIYSIHSRNSELIHIIEEFQVELDEKTLEKCIIEAIKCHHNDFANYFIDKSDQKKFYLQSFLEYDNYELIPIDQDSYSQWDISIEKIPTYIKYDPEFFNLLFKESYLDINAVQDNKSLFYLAIQNDNIELLQYLLKNPKINPNIEIPKKYYENKTAQNALYMSIEENKIEITKLLLSCPNTNVNIINAMKYTENKCYVEENKTALSRAVEKGNIEIIKQLIKCPEIQPNIILKKSYYGLQSKNEEKTALSIAIIQENIEIIEILLSNEKTSPNSMIYVDSKRKSELQLAIEKGNKDIIQLLLKNQRLNPNLFIEKSPSEKTVLSKAIEEENIDLINLLLSCPNIDPNIRHKIAIKNSFSNYDYKTPLSMAIEKGNIEIIKILLKCPKIDPNIIFKTGIRDFYDNKCEEKAALLLAVEKENIEIIQLLLKCPNIDPNIVFKTGILSYNKSKCEEKTVLLLAVEKENIEIVQLLLKCPIIDPNIILKKKIILSAAIETGNNEIIKLLLNDKNINPNLIFKNKCGCDQTVLSKAIDEENIDLIKLLLSCPNIDLETKINKTIKYGDEITFESTIMQLAIYKKNKTIIRLLFEYKKNNK